MPMLYLVAFALATWPAVAQGGRSGAADAPSEEGIGPPEPLVEATVSPVADAAGSTGGAPDAYRVTVTYHIPAGNYQVDNRDFLYFTVEDAPAGYSLTEIDYPPQNRDGGWAETLRLTAVLRANTGDRAETGSTGDGTGSTGGVRDSVAGGTVENLTVTAYYQLCSDEGLCYMPASVGVRAARSEG